MSTWAIGAGSISGRPITRARISPTRSIASPITALPRSSKPAPPAAIWSTTCAGIDGFAHMPRDKEVDDELFGLLKQRPDVFFQQTLWGERRSFYNGKPAWLDEPLLRETFSAEELRLLGEQFTPKPNMTPQEAQ